VSETRRGAPLLGPNDDFAPRHLGPDETDVAAMLEVVGAPSLEALVAETIPAGIRLEAPLDLPAARGERDAILALRGMAAKNRVLRSFLGMGYHDCITPPVIQDRKSTRLNSSHRL